MSEPVGGPSIRFASPADAATIHRFICELAAYERAAPGTVEVTPELLEKQMTSDRPPFECLLAEHAGQPAGMALFFQNYSTWSGGSGIYLEDLFVSLDHRGKGVGQALMQRLAAVAKQRGHSRLAWAVLDWNVDARKFYAKLGAEQLSDWVMYRIKGPELDSLADSDA